MTTPTIHLNGTSGQDLIDGYRTAMDAVRAAQEGLTASYPNARDYYPQGHEAWQAATREHCERQAKLKAVYDELEALAIYCDEQVTERQRRIDERKSHQ